MLPAKIPHINGLERMGTKKNYPTGLEQRCLNVASERIRFVRSRESGPDQEKYEANDGEHFYKRDLVFVDDRVLHLFKGKRYLDEVRVKGARD